jgi:diacylglycerol kinase (ATP)
MERSKYKIFFIINPVAGRGRAALVAEVIEQYIDREKFNHQILVSNKQGQVELLAAQAIEEGADVIVAVGGDGTVNEVAKKIIHTDIILGIIPLGSGNGLGNHLKIPHNAEKAIALINRLQIMRIDTGAINGLYFVSVAGIGFDAVVARQYARSGKRGLKTYVRYTMRKYFSYKPGKYKIRFNGEVIFRKALLITFANSDQFGYNTSIAPKAKSDDGYLDMCILEKIPLLITPFTLPRLFTRRIHTSRFHESHHVKEATVFRKRTSVIQIDGEPVRMKERILHIRIHEKSLSVIC